MLEIVYDNSLGGNPCESSNGSSVIVFVVVVVVIAVVIVNVVE